MWKLNIYIQTLGNIEIAQEPTDRPRYSLESSEFSFKVHVRTQDPALLGLDSRVPISSRAVGDCKPGHHSHHYSV